jgi:ABC-type polysaccharide/polyol phosphate export permease
MPAFSGLASSWAVQRRVIFALLMREVLTRYGRHNIGFLWLFVEPMIFTLAVTALWTATESVHGSSLPIVAFAITGYSSVLLSLLYHRNVRPMDIYFARLLLEAAGATISFVFLVLLFMFLESLNPPEDVLQIVGGWLMLAWFGFSLALFLGALSERYEIIDKLWHPAAYILFPLSGAAFLVDALPSKAQEFVLLLPMVHGVEYLREGYFGSAIVAHYDLAYMGLWNIILTFLGLIQLRTVSRTVVPE